jgi:hypothetical protein
MKGKWIETLALLSNVHQDEFEEVYAEAVDPGDAIITIQHGLIRARVRDPLQDGLLLALPDDFGQRCMVGPGRYWFPAEDWARG